MNPLIDEFDEDGGYAAEVLAALCPCMDDSCQWCLDGIAARALESVRQYEIKLLREMWET